MKHLGENEKPLKTKEIILSKFDKINDHVDAKEAYLWLIRLPSRNQKLSESVINEIRSFIDILPEKSVISFISHPYTTANLFIELNDVINYQLWIPIKLNKEIKRESYLNCAHDELLILSKYEGSLNHVKLRTAYTYCPFCERTTKDYGGKKHLYNEFGTLMSDIWREIEYESDGELDNILNRMADLFSVDELSRMNLIDLLDSQIDLYSPKESSSKNKADVNFNGLSNHSSLINADSLDALKDIPSNSMDFCYADPPYNIDKKYDTWDDSLEIEEYFDWCDKWLDELARVLKPGRTCAILNIPVYAIRHFKFLDTTLNFQDWIVWEALSLPVRNIMPAHYSIICFTKGESRALPGHRNKKINESLLTQKQWYCSRQSCKRKRKRIKANDHEFVSNIWWDIHRLKHNSKRVDHPTQLPPALMKRLISLFTNEDEIVLDPFNGAGTTTLCADILDRKYIGIEISEKYHNMTVNRHSEISSGLDPFRKKNKVPKAKNSRVKRIKKRNYKVPKKKLQLDVRRIAKKIGEIPAREQVKEHSNYPIKFYDDYFIDWGEVTAAARTTGMSEMREEDNKQTSLFEQ